MANITEYVKKIREAIYGKDVRESIAAGIEAINTESQNAKESAETAASNAQKAANDAEAAISTAATATVMASEAAGKANTAAETAAEKAQAADLAASGANAAAGAAQAAKEAANTAAELANSKAAAAETAAGQANTAAGAAQEAKTAAQTAAGAAQTQGNYAKAQGDRAAQLVDEIEDTDVGGMAADILALQSGKADLVNGKVPESQLPELDFDPAGSAAAVQKLLTSHTENQENPHGVTATQLGVTAKRTCTLVVGTSTAGWTAEDCDYLCDGVNDQVEIQEALDSLPETGGKIVVLSGTYKINNQIQISTSKTTLAGMGSSTVFKATSAMAAMITTGALNSHITICNLSLDCGSFNNVSNQYGVLLGGVGIGHTVAEVKVSNGDGGILAYGSGHKIIFNEITVRLNGINASCSNSDIAYNIINETTANSSGEGIQAPSGTMSNKILGNTVSSAWSGIFVYGENHTVGENNISGCARGVVCNQAKFCVVNNNTIIDCSLGIFASYASCSLIASNVVRYGNGDPSDWAVGTMSIFISGESKYNLIANNMIKGKSYENEAGETNTFINNKYE